jgi:hypothetical protein
MRRRRECAVGLAYRWPIDGWIRAHLDQIEVLEVTVDTCISGTEAARAAIFDLVGRVPITAHGVGLSIGTDAPLDLAYLDRVAEVVCRLGAMTYSEHLAFTRVPGRELGNLLPVPRTSATARAIITKVRRIQSRVPVPFLLENIAFVFDWRGSTLSHAEFLNRICGETGAKILLDVENLYLNSHNHDLDASSFLDPLPEGAVAQVHVAGGAMVSASFLKRPFLADTHDQPAPDGALALLDQVMARQTPLAIILERDGRLNFAAEILDDLARIRARLRARGKALA